MYSPGQVAEKTGFDPNTLRTLCNTHLKPYLDAERLKKRPRQFTERDVQILTLVHRWHYTDGLTYPEIVQQFETRGVDACLQEAIGSTELARATLQENRELMEKTRELMAHLETARALIAKHRELQARVHVTVAHWERHLLELATELRYAQTALKRAAQGEEALRINLSRMGLLGWLLGGRRELELRLEQAGQARQEAEEKVERIYNTMQAFQLQELQRLLGMARSIPDDVIDLADPDPETAPGSETEEPQ